MTSTPVLPSPPPLSEMEIQRQKNIARNQAFIASLGIVKPTPVQRQQRTRKRKEPSAQRVATEPARRSRRLAQEEPELKPVGNPDSPATREVRRLAAPRHDPTPAQIEYATTNDGTASKAHCLHRVRTMTDAALANRIKAIERARGRFCVTKMAVFAEVLRDEGKLELAEAAEEALARLQLPET